ncbi:Hint domain-containing protein [uncultured Jannaschia sp.]|uniref:Hint domain-containing protein n=1 Tax=uncultured Jannaschia sp. TaxID=293347 RepID=UPI00262220DF|nr:Hint domain-containing protein [uncultured Jannaschia sp.]
MSAFERFPAINPAIARHPVRVPEHLAEYDLAWLDHRGAVCRDLRHLPATPILDAAVSSFGRGTLLQNGTGPVAIEDVTPGDRVAVRGGGFARVDWVGSRLHGGPDAQPTLFRVAAHAFGALGPTQDTVLGAHALVLIEHPACAELVGGPSAFAPLAAFEDGFGVTAITPKGDVATWGIACAGEEAVLAGGLGVASYHPARATCARLTRNALADLARLFPQSAAGAGFGAPRLPTITMAEARAVALSAV